VLEPSLQSHPVAPAARAWRLRPQLLVALAGGLLAFAPLALANARRLGLPRRRRLVVAAVVAAAVAGAALASLGSHDGHAAALLLWDRPFALAAAWLVRALEATHDRAYHFYRAAGESYAPLARVGLTAVAAAVAVQVALALAAHAGALP
jgi:hypothetical protein